MAGPIMRTFWTVEGKVDKDGHPIEYPTEAAAKAQSSAGGIGGSGIGQGVPLIGGAPKPATKVTESMTEDGEYVQTVDGPDGQPQEIGRGVDKARLELYNARRGAAKDARTGELKPLPTRTLPDGTMEEMQPDGSWRVLGTKPQGPPAPSTEAPTIHTRPDGSQEQWNPATRQWEPYAGAKPAPAATIPGLGNAPAERPGQLTNLDLVYAQANQFIAGVNADTNLSLQARQAKIQAYLDGTVKPAAEQATREANAYAQQQQQRQQETAARAGRTEERQSTTAERQTRVAEDRLALDTQKASYDRGQDAVSNALKLLQYQVDPSFSPALAGIYNRIMPGAFQPNAFQTALPDIDAIAQAHVGPLLDMHASPVTGPTAQGAAALTAAQPGQVPGQPQPDPLANVPITPRAPYPQPGGTGIVGPFGQ